VSHDSASFEWCDSNASLTIAAASGLMGRMIAKLVPTGAVAPRREIVLDIFPLRLGRTGGADICIDDRWVSRTHCEIDLEHDGLVIRDLGSKHGTYVNGRMTKCSALRSGDEVSLGLTRFVVRCEADLSEARGELTTRRDAGGQDPRCPVGAREL
jgi:pSer/pThr/pTyr-binding forkhead associated (FHA) protein